MDIKVKASENRFLPILGEQDDLLLLALGLMVLEEWEPPTLMRHWERMPERCRQWAEANPREWISTEQMALALEQAMALLVARRLVGQATAEELRSVARHLIRPNWVHYSSKDVNLVVNVEREGVSTDRTEWLTEFHRAWHARFPDDADQWLMERNEQWEWDLLPEDGHRFPPPAMAERFLEKPQVRVDMISVPAPARALRQALLVLATGRVEDWLDHAEYTGAPLYEILPSPKSPGLSQLQPVLRWALSQHPPSERVLRALCRTSHDIGWATEFLQSAVKERPKKEQQAFWAEIRKYPGWQVAAETQLWWLAASVA